MLNFYANGAWRTGKRGQAYVGARWRTLTRGMVYQGGAWRRIFTFVPPIMVSVSPETATGNRLPARPSYGVVTSNVVTATPSGGTAPFSYQWTVSGGVTTATAPSQASTAFTAGLAAESADAAMATVVVTDSLGAAASTAIAVELTNFSTA